MLIYLAFFPTFSDANSSKSNQTRHPFYTGIIGGYGSTTWDGLVPSLTNQNFALNISTPIQTIEGGAVWGVYGGYEFSPHFAFEGSYMRYKDATIIFDPESLFSFDHNDLTSFTSRTETISAMAKFMLFVPKTKVRVYSSVGAARLHRKDILVNHWRFTPTFGLGFNYPITEHLLAELGGNYTAGFGESQLSPTNSYFPFLYSMAFRLAYCF